MRFKWVATCFAITFLCGQVLATDQEQKRQAAEDKAQVLEQKAVEKGSEKPVPKSEAITSSEAQAVDPAGAAPLDDAITCLARSIYWELTSSPASRFARSVLEGRGFLRR